MSFMEGLSAMICMISFSEMVSPEKKSDSSER